jgi:hypothetical protein
MALEKLPGIRTLGYTPTTTPATTTPASTYMAGSMAISSIASAFSSWQAGQMQKLAYDHEAAMAEINAKQIQIEGQFLIADKTNALVESLALQNVMAAAGGRSGGSVSNLAQTSVANLKKDEARIKATGEARKVSTLMGASASRAAGQTAATQGLIGGISDLNKGVAEAYGWIA